jgi:hypothetical protein
MRIRWILLGLNAAVTGILLATPASGYQYWEQCGNWSESGNGVGWLGTSQLVTTDTYSYPSGSAQASALSNAITQWNKYTYWISNYASRYDTTVVTGDGVSEAFLANSSTLGTNVLGHTWPIWAGCDFPVYYDYIKEMDVALLNTLQWGDPDESGWNCTGGVCGSDGFGRMVQIHEFGHGLGLAHDSAHLNNMHPSPQYPFIGGGESHAQVLADDALAVINMYSNHPAEHLNLQASAQMLSGGSVVNTAFHGSKFFPYGYGGSFQMSFTAINPGPSNVTFDQGFYLSTSPTLSGGIQFGWWSGGTVNAHSVVTWQNITFNIPSSLARGTYWVFHMVDPFWTVQESDFNDNWVHNVLTIQVY